MTSHRNSPSVVPAQLSEVARLLEQARQQRDQDAAREERRRQRLEGTLIAARGPARNRVRRAFSAWLEQVRRLGLPLTSISRGERVAYSKARVVPLPPLLPTSNAPVSLWLCDYFRQGQVKLQVGYDGLTRELTSLAEADLTFLADYFSGDQVWNDLQTLFNEAIDRTRR